MEKKIYENIIKYNLIEKGDTIVIGVSGGHDSMSLLYSLYSIKDKVPFDIAVVHVNHGVRGEFALRDENFVKSEASKLNLDYYSKKVDMNQYAKDHQISSEEAGRILRYSFFREVLSKYQKGKIAVGHNKNDQAETIMMRVIRGTGLDGLKGMDYVSGDIIRPMLDISRQEIEEYIDINNIPVVIDHTNLENEYTRNKVRLDLFPYIEKEFNPNLIESLCRLSDNAKRDLEFLDEYTSLCYNDVVKYYTNEKITINLKKMEKYNKNIIFRVIRKAIENILGNIQGFEEVHIKDVYDLILNKKTGKSIDLPNKIIAKIDYNNLVIGLKSNNSEEVEIYEELDLGLNFINGDIIHIGIRDSEDYKDIKKGKYIAIFDYDKVKGNLVLRNRKPGDKFKPYGMNGTKKIKDFFIDNKISREDRDKVLLIADEENIIWIVGYRTSEDLKVTKNTKKLLVIDFRQLNV